MVVGNKLPARANSSDCIHPDFFFGNLDSPHKAMHHTGNFIADYGRLGRYRQSCIKHIEAMQYVNAGQAYIKGTRIPVHQIVSMLAHGDTIEDLLEEYPSLSREDILACLEYAAFLAEEEISPLERPASSE